MGIRDWIDALSETEEIDEAKKKKRKRTARRKKPPVYGGAAPWYSGLVGSGECGDAVSEGEDMDEDEDADDETLTLTQRVNVAHAAVEKNPTPENMAVFKRLYALWNEQGARDRQREETERAERVLQKPQDGYRGEHEAPDRTNGAPLHDLTVNGIYPGDFYSPNGIGYCGDDDRHAYGAVQAFRKRPHARVKVYRAVPRDPAIKRINPGDWVTLHRRYAVEHGRDTLRSDYKILTKIVAARDLFTDGNSLLEWGYDPKPSHQERSASSKS